jgi:hypothetical protein
MAYTISNPMLGLLPIANTDAGVSINGSTVVTPPLRPGMIVQGQDPTYGGAEFILLAGVANTAVGSVVTYNQTTFTTTLGVAGTNLPQPVAIAMSANTSSSTWGWYQISGIAVVKKTTTATIDASAAVGISGTAGAIGATSTGNEIEGCLVAASAVATATTTTIVINRPHMMGRTAD